MHDLNNIKDKSAIFFGLQKSLYLKLRRRIDTNIN